MKQILLSLFAISALFVSCSKETLTENNESGSSAVQVPSKGGIPVSFTVGAPDLGEEETDGEETKVSGSQSSSTKYSFQWKKGDKIAIFAYEPDSSATPLKIIDCGDFVAQNDGASATFTGTLPDTLKKLKWTSVYALANAGSERTLAHRNETDRYYVKDVYLSPEQDGDGFKYSQYASTGWTLTYDTDNNPSFGTVGNLSLSDAVLKFDLSGIGTGNRVYKMVIRLELSNPKTYTQYLTGKLWFQTSDPKVNSAGSDKTVTIYNGGADLPSTVYATTRQTSGSATYGYSSLVTYFYYKDSENNDKMDVKTIKLATFNGDGTVKAYKNASAGYIYKLKAIPALQDKFIINWIAGVQSPTVFAPSGSSYKAFPYANSSTSSAITELRDGKGGTIITPTSGTFYYAPVRNYVFKMGAMETELEMGPAKTSQGEIRTDAYYHYPGTYSYMRTGNCYIKIPAKEGYRLSRVKVGVDNAKNAGTIYVCTGASTTSSIGSASVMNATPMDISFDASKTAANTAYYLIAGDRFVTNFTFEYVPASAE